MQAVTSVAPGGKFYQIPPDKENTVRGGLGGQFPRNLNGNEMFLFSPLLVSQLVEPMFQKAVYILRGCNSISV